MHASLVYKDEQVVAFRDINPQAPTHIILIPVLHIASLNDLMLEQDEMIGHLIRIAAQLAQEEGVAEEGYRLVVNCGPAAGQSVDHIHFHLLAGRNLGWPPG
jgi:histidine triad (HIT) family protein